MKMKVRDMVTALASAFLTSAALAGGPASVPEIDATLQKVVDGLCNGDANTCSTVVGPTGPAGQDGNSCTVTQNQGSATITCTDGTSASVADGSQGPKGDTGEKGGSCTVTQNNGAATISCDDGSTATVSDGEQGPPGPGVDPAQLQSLCMAADLRGDSYRPTFCDARCDCAYSISSTQDLTCQEVSPGDFKLQENIQIFPGYDSNCVPPPSCASYCGALCQNGGLGPCCQVIQGQPVCAPPLSSYCSVPSEELATPCDYLASSCPQGQQCVPTVAGTGYCSLTCQTNSDCDEYDFPPANSTIDLALYSGVSSTRQIEPVTCQLTPMGGPITTKQINGNDALKCIADIEAAGVSCTKLQ